MSAPPCPPPRRPGAWPRVVVYGALALGLLPVLGQLRPRQARADLALLVAELETSQADGLACREGLASINFLPGEGYAVSLFVANDERFAPARIMVALRSRQPLQVELLVGIRHTIVLRGAQAEEYLARVGISLAPIEALFLARHPRPRTLEASLTPVGK